MAINKIKTGSINDSAVTTDKIQDSAVTNAKVSPSAAIAQSKVSGLATSISNLCTSISSVSSDIQQQADNIALLGFKMAVNDGLTVFNLIDGVVDEFNDESGTDEAEGSNDTYNATDDYYVNSNSPTGDTIPLSTPYSAGFAIRTVTEPDTSCAATNPTIGAGTPGTYTVGLGVTSMSVKMWGAGGGGGYYGNVGTGFVTGGTGGGGGFVSGTVAVTPGQSILVGVAEGGTRPSQPTYNGALHADHPTRQGNSVGERKNPGGAGAGYIACSSGGFSGPQSPSIFMVAGGGGQAGDNVNTNQDGGAGGGLTGCAGGQSTEQTSYVQAQSARHGGGGSQCAGGQGGSPCGSGDGGLLYGMGRGGAGWYGGGGGTGDDGPTPNDPQYAGGAGGGGSSYYGHPQVSSGSTEEGGNPNRDGGGVPDPQYVPGTNEGTNVNDPQGDVHPAINPGGPTSPSGQGSGCGANYGEDGYILITATAGPVAASTLSTTITSGTFTSSSVATSARIVVFEENVDTPTLNTDVIASISRDGTNFTNATLSDSGYVTGSSGQRILTGQADISGQPSGQSMRWKLALANNTVKIHGVALQWS
jgi:hypothetical protein